MAHSKSRLDVLLVERGLVPSRERARAVILAGHVRVDGQVVSKAGAPVGESAQVELTTPDHPYVGRGGLKLAHALDLFGIAVEGRRTSGTDQPSCSLTNYANDSAPPDHQ